MVIDLVILAGLYSFQDHSDYTSIQLFLIIRDLQILGSWLFCLPRTLLSCTYVFISKHQPCEMQMTNSLCTSNGALNGFQFL